METAFVPRILKETSSGLFLYDIQDEMLCHREIECLGEINAASAGALLLQLRYLARSAPGEEITVYINSPGGEVAGGLAVCDAFKASGCPIRTVCVGTAASMGAVIFAAGDTREMLPHARLMIHDPLIDSGTGGSALKLKRLSDDLLQTRERLCTLLAERSGRTLDEIYEKTAEDTWFDAQQAIEFGLADRIAASF